MLRRILWTVLALSSCIFACGPGEINDDVTSAYDNSALSRHRDTRRHHRDSTGSNSSDLCQGVTCSGHGTCVERGQSAMCQCASGYSASGLTCLADDDPCQGVTCSGHGTCVESGQSATCQCASGYSASGLTCVVESVTGNTSTLDRFGIKMIHPTASGAREWFNKWDKGPEREYRCDSRKQDAVDPEQLYNGDGTFHIYGSTGAYPGQMLIYGMEPRIYVRASTADNPPAGTPVWKNVEVTFYGKTTSYDSNTEEWTWAGLEAVVRTDHWPFDLAHDCSTAGYGGRMLFNGLMDFEKEVSHNRDSNKRTRQVTNGSKQYWPSSQGMPMNTWIGFKLVARSVENDAKVRLELYLDLSDGAHGGEWQGPIISFDDYNGWSGDMSTACTSRPAGAVLGANYTVYLRTDALDRSGKDMQYYKYFSVREIDPLP